MKAASTIAALGLATVAAAGVVRRQAPSEASVSSYAVDTASSAAGVYPSSFGAAPTYYPTGTASGLFPTGTAPPNFPTGTAPPFPIGTGTACPVDGALVCSSDGTQFGLCNFGSVVFQPVAAGTQCRDGQIEFADGYPGGAAPTGTYA